MNRFATGREAKEYLINRILSQADLDGASLSEVERKMLYFSETAWTLPDMMEINQAFDETHNQEEYENKIGRIIRNLLDDSSSRDDFWLEAVRRLRDEDHYLLVLIDGASSRYKDRPAGDTARLILASLVVVGVFFPVLFFINSHVANTNTSKFLGEGALLLLAVAVTYLANRPKRNSV